MKYIKKLELVDLKGSVVATLERFTNTSFEVNGEIFNGINLGAIPTRFKHMIGNQSSMYTGYGEGIILSKRKGCGEKYQIRFTDIVYNNCDICFKFSTMIYYMANGAKFEVFCSMNRIDFDNDPLQIGDSCIINYTRNGSEILINGDKISSLIRKEDIQKMISSENNDLITISELIYDDENDVTFVIKRGFNRQDKIDLMVKNKIYKIQ